MGEGVGSLLDEGVVIFLNEGVVELLDKYNKDGFDVDISSILDYYFEHILLAYP